MIKRVFIGIFGRRNVGKSTLINAMAGQEIAIVSDFAGTTTDPVKKTIEIFGLGPTVLVDTAGIDDSGEVGVKRVEKTLDTISTIDVAILLIADNQFDTPEQMLIQKFKQLQVPFVIVHGKSDLQPLSPALEKQLQALAPTLSCSGRQRVGIDRLIAKIVQITPTQTLVHQTFVGDIVQPHDLVVLVMPQDSEAPEGRLILPQVQLIRDLLDHHAVAIGLQPAQLEEFLKKQTPNLIITDSQVFAQMAPIVPTHIPLTSFSIVLARAKGNFGHYLQGTPFISKLRDGDRVLILESCTHVTSCQDIGRVKLPALIKKFTGKNIDFELVTALSPLPKLADFAMAIQCGGCMVTQKQLANRIQKLLDANMPVSNYGMAIAFMTGIFERVTAMFCDKY